MSLMDILCTFNFISPAVQIVRDPLGRHAVTEPLPPGWTGAEVEAELARQGQHSTSRGHNYIWHGDMVISYPEPQGARRAIRRLPRR